MVGRIKRDGLSVGWVRSIIRGDELAVAIADRYGGRVSYRTGRDESRLSLRFKSREELRRMLKDLLKLV